MSLPKHTTSTFLSSSPSKQSVRRTPESNASRPESSNARPIPQQARALSQEPQAHEPANVTSPGAENDLRDIQPTSHPPLQPFFTVIEDSNTATYYHPTVHYIFSDDDTDIVTEAALRSLEAEQDNLPRYGKGKARTRDHSSQVDEEEDGLPSPRKEPMLPSPIPGVRDHYIILDMDTATTNDAHSVNAVSAHDTIATSPGTQSAAPQHLSSESQNYTSPQNQSQFRVGSAYSLSPTWQVLNTQLVPAPTFENSSEQPLNGGLMLKIQGTAGLPMSMPARDREKDNSTQRLEEMMEQFSKRLGELRQVIESGGHTDLQGDIQEGAAEEPTQNAEAVDGQTHNQNDIANQEQFQ
ncbi:hypothetical protein BDV25DRAFT_142429 [Aspergillus avenaceus]|uniref:Uncharacterized protein n=1 Tax=Aspergillus avenaceus TaxID=36643 RepID=A0A5N6TNU4_ASPAV|nr:hypothetical protein BDV25DRAFT_142429 [Aspergillus avenaceus]